MLVGLALTTLSAAHADPAWWPQFERQFADYVARAARER
jgi:hypothetical protein